MRFGLESDENRENFPLYILSACIQVHAKRQIDKKDPFQFFSHKRLVSPRMKIGFHSFT